MVLKKNSKSSSDLYIAAIGASAGGLEALQKLISHIPADIKNVAFIVVQHLSPTYKSMLVQTLGSQTKLEVVEAKNNIQVRERYIYITPPNCEISIKKGKLFLSKSTGGFAAHPSIDRLLTSLAADRQQKAIGVILSGTGSDGAEGIRAIKRAGGITMVQNPRSAKYNSMPLAAIDTRMADFVLTPEKIGEQIALITTNDKRKLVRYSNEEVSNHKYEEIIELLSKETGTDFTNYKRNTLYRRIDKHIAELKLDSAEKYLKHIDKNHGEIETLFYFVLIGVTSFFRDPAVFKALEKHLSALIDSKLHNAPVRVWVPGCATGEEVYSVAIIIADILKRKKRVLPIQIFGTDINEQALNTARKAVYSTKEITHVSAERVKDYFIRHNGYMELSKAIRGMVLFSRHDLTHNPPFLKLDLVVCRNLLIYFNSKLQDYVLPVFSSALNPHGYLLLGKSEGIGHFTGLFTAVNRDAKIFQRKVGSPLNNARYTALSPKEIFKYKPVYEFSISEMVKETLYKVFEHPYVVINDNADIKEIKGDVSRYLGLKQGQMNANLFKLAHEDLRIELRSLINKCIKENKEAKGSVRRLNIYGKEHLVKMMVRPLLHSESPNEFYLVVFEEVKNETNGNAKPAVKGSTGNNARIKELELELDATKEDLQNFIERIESVNAEFQTVNEELQSSNEELETANEELQSTYEEINIAYSELKGANIVLEKQETLLRKSETNINALLNNSVQSFVLIDKEHRIIAFNDLAVKTFKNILGLKLSEGENFQKLVSRKEFAPFAADFNSACKGKASAAERKIRDKQQKEKTFMFNFTPVMDGNGQPGCISFSMLDITEWRKTKTELSKSENLIESVFHTADIGIAIVDCTGKIIKANSGFSKLFGYSMAEVTGMSWFKVFAPADQKEVKLLHSEILAGKALSFERKARHKDGSFVDIYISNQILRSPDGNKFIIKTVRDITEAKKYKELLQRTETMTKIGGFELDTATKKIIWTEEMYNIYEVGKDFIPTLARILKFYTKEYSSKLKQAVHNAVVSGNKFDGVLQLMTGKGNLKWLRVRFTPTRLKSKSLKLIGTIQDITSGKLAEQEIERLSWVASHTNNSVIITDENANVEWVNKSFEKLTGYKLDEIKGENPGYILQGARTDKEVVKRIREKLQKHLPSTGEILLNYTKHGEPVWISSDITPIFKEGKLISFVGIMTDLTDLIRTKEIQEKQEALLQKQQLFNAIAKYFPNGIIGVINKDLNYVFVGGTELKKLELNHKELIGDKIFDKIHQESTTYAEPFLKRTFMNETVSFEVSISDSTYLVNAVPIKNHDEPISQALVVIHNITQQKTTEEELLKAIERQKELNDLKSKFVSIASHEFRTPLSTILSSTFLVENYNKPGDEIRREKHLSRIKSSVNSLTDILNEFLTLGKMEEGGLKNRPALFDILLFFKELIGEMKVNLKTRQQIKFSHKGDSHMAYLDIQHFKNMLINLLSNAIKYSSEGKTIHLTSSFNKGSLEVSVRDEGIGIPAEDQKHLFNTFYRAHNATNIQGTGMGLHIVKRYLDIMEGTVQFASQINKGSTFTVRFPQATMTKTSYS